MKKLWKKLEGSWSEALNKIYDAKADAALEALVNDEAYCEKMEKQAEEPEWQPYPVSPDRYRSEEHE